MESEFARVMHSRDAPRPASVPIDPVGSRPWPGLARARRASPGLTTGPRRMHRWRTAHLAPVDHQPLSPIQSTVTAPVIRSRSPAAPAGGTFHRSIESRTPPSARRTSTVAVTLRHHRGRRQWRRHGPGAGCRLALTRAAVREHGIILTPVKRSRVSARALRRMSVRPEQRHHPLLRVGVGVGRGRHLQKDRIVGE